MFYLRKQNLNFKINFYNIEMTYTHVGEIQRKRRKENKKMREFSTYTGITGKFNLLFLQIKNRYIRCALICEIR